MSDVVAAASSWLAEKVWWTILGLIVVTVLLLPRKKISLLGVVMWVVAVAVILGLAAGCALWARRSWNRAARVHDSVRGRQPAQQSLRPRCGTMLAGCI
jgi:hypothetical protein